MKSKLIQDAVLRNLQTLGQSAKNISDKIKSSHTEIVWRGIVAFRNVLVHGYLGIDLNQIWDVIERDVPDLKKKIEAIIASTEDTNR